MQVRVTHIDTACILLELNGYRILTDPVLDPAGSFYHFGWGTFSKKLKSPAMQPRDLGRIDLVLLSHDQHEDNLDHAGREFIKTVPRVLSTRPASKASKASMIGRASPSKHRRYLAFASLRCPRNTLRCAF